MPRLSKVGAAALAAFGWTGLQTVNVDFLVVAGGGGAGSAFGGGGGAGGYRCSVTGEPSGGGASAEAKLSLNPTQSYTVTVGAGGTGSTGSGTNGNDSVLSTITSTGGGYGGGAAAGGSGGSGGGAGSYGGAPTFAAAAGTANQGFAGGQNTGSANYGTGGGGGAGAVGGTGTTTVVGSGGTGVSSSITGSSVGRAGGGGGAGGVGFITTPGTASDGGGAGSSGGAVGTAGTANTGGGGGAGSYSGATWASGGQGGSGVVIISYVGAQQFGGGIVTSSGGNTIHTFTTSGTLSPLNSLTASYLIVAGGGGGAATAANGQSGGAGGGGAGGLLSGSSLTIDTNSIYAVTVGAGGLGSTTSAASGSNGSNSSFSMVSTAAVGGGGGACNGSNNGSAGGSGGGGYGFPLNTYNGGAGTVGQGNDGGRGHTDGATYTTGGGGGGAGAAATQKTSNSGGDGGAGTPNSISGSSVTYAGGGGGGGSGGAGGTAGTGGGNGGAIGVAGSAGTANLGGGGGGAGGGNTPVVNGGNGGSGIVIISYAGSTQQMAGGTVTVAGGNVIHTFTSSGFLTPIVLTTNSLRFRSSASAYLNRTPATETNRRTFTLSYWVKRGELGIADFHWEGGSPDGSTTRLYGRFNTDNTITIGTGTAFLLVTTQVFRDPAAWYHIVVAVDTTNATADNRIRLYINGQEVTAFGTRGNPSQNADTGWNMAQPHSIGRSHIDSGNYFDGYITEFNAIDGQQLTPFSFGTTSDLGVWQPIRYGGSYGTNGFYLKFTDTTNTTTLGYDSSPNSNNWTTNNISLTAGTTYDSMTDVPTLTSATAANYCVFNPLDKDSNITTSNGNLAASTSTVDHNLIRSTIAIPSSGKFYAEMRFDQTMTGNPAAGFGLISPSASLSAHIVSAGNYSVYGSAATTLNSGATSGASVTGMTSGQIWQFAVDADNNQAWIGLNNAWYNVYTSGATTGDPSAGTNPTFTGTMAGLFLGADFVNSSGSINFGQQPFTYTPPTGFKALNTFNLPAPPSGIGTTAAELANEYFDATVYTGTNANLSIVNSGAMQPDFVWIKNRGPSARAHNLVDSVRGSHQVLFSNDTAVEATSTITTGVLSFASNGFNLGLDTSTAGSTNASGESHIAWQWRASNTTAVTNTNGSITSTVSASTTAGFSIVTYTGTGGTGTTTVGHGCQVGGVPTAPSMVIIKRRDGITNWASYHTGLTSTSYYLVLNSTAAQANYGSTFISPSSSTLTIAADSSLLNTSTGTYVAYCFAPVAGYSAFGSYTGNGSATEGPFVYLGFRPRFVMVKRYDTSSTGNWSITDTSINPYNNTTGALRPNTAETESTVGTVYVQPVSNGFYISNNNTDTNASSGTYIYMAFAENPFKYANAR